MAKCLMSTMGRSLWRNVNSCRTVATPGIMNSTCQMSNTSVDGDKSVTKDKKQPYKMKKEEEAKHVKQVDSYRGLIEYEKEVLLKYEGGSIDLVKDDRHGFATIFINNPSKKNAMSGKMMSDLADIVDELQTWDKAKVLILTGKGDTFCSGGDLNFVRDIANPDDGNMMSMFMQKTLTRLQQLPIISVALVQGRALGGGAELTLACDFRLMTDESEIRFLHGRMGVSTGWGGGTRLVNIVGPSTALHLLTSCRGLNARDAIDMGLCSLHMQKDEDPMDTALEWLKLHTDQLTKEVVYSIKKTVWSASLLPMEESLKKERDLFQRVWGSEAHLAAINKGLQ